MLSAQPHIEDLVSSERLRPLRRAEYDWMVDQGFFQDEKVELLEGIIVEMSPEGPRHAATIERLNRLFVLRVRRPRRVRAQCPYAASEISEPDQTSPLSRPGTTIRLTRRRRSC